MFNAEDQVQVIVNEIRKSFPNGDPSFPSVMVSLAKLHSDKNKDYGGKESPYGNFERVSKLLEIYPLFGTDKYLKAKVGLLYMLKQFDAVMNSLSEDRELSTEGISSRLNDIAVYAVLVELMIKEEFDSKWKSKT